MIYKFFVGLTFFLQLVTTGYTQSILEDIPQELLDHASIVALDELLQFDIKDTQYSQEIYSITYIVLKEGVDITASIEFNEFTKVKKASLKIYDKHNKLIEKYKSRDFKKQLNNYGSISTDSGVKSLSLARFTPPYKVVFEYTVKNKYSLFYPRWNPIDKPNKSILHSSLIVTDYTKHNLRYKGYNIEPPDINSTEDYTRYRWDVDHTEVFIAEPFDNENDYLPIVLLAANKVYADGYEGNLNSWNAIGEFINKLNSSRNNFTDENKTEILSIVKNAKSNREKTELIYAYLQESTRYASIQLGIGGWRPFETSFTHKKKYGDCKALSFYTQAMLTLVGVPSYYTLVRAGRHPNEIPSDFPTMSFNHAFLMVPLDKDTTWLECTTQTLPFGFLGYFTNDRNVLVVTDNGGQLIRTKAYTADENKSSYIVKVKMDLEGNTHMNIQKKMVGPEIMNYNLLQFKEKNIYDHLDIGNFKIEHFNFIPLEKVIIPKFQIDVQITKPNYGEIIGDRMLIKPFIFNQIKQLKLTKKQRIHPLHLRESFMQNDDISIRIPDGYNVEKKIENISINTKYGSYELEFSWEGIDIHCKRKLIINKGSYPVEEYHKVKDFFDLIIKYDNRKIVLIRS